MNITTKFSYGDKVCAIFTHDARKIIECVTCQKTGTVTIGDENFVCPKCHGKSSHPVYVGQKWFIDIEDSKVGQVRAEFFKKESLEDHDYGAVYPVLKVEYMLEASGVGSGTIWKEENLFASRELAQAECDKRNLENDTQDAEHY